MRTILRPACTAAPAVLLATGGLHAACAAPPTVADALGLAPYQKGVSHDEIAADQVKDCTIGMERQGSLNAWVVRGPRGEVLRSFVDTNGDRVVDRWSYYKDGAEVYRDIDSNFNAKADQARWLGAGGTRWGIDEGENGSIDRWKAISPEEATAEIVAALQRRDAAAFRLLLPTKADLQAAGFEEPLLSDLTIRVTAAAKGFEQLAASTQNPLGPTSRWTAMLAPRPGTLAAGTPGVGKDVMAYDNVVVVFDDEGGGGRIHVGSLVRIGDAWRPVDLPRMPDEPGDNVESALFFPPRVPPSASRPR